MSSYREGLPAILESDQFEIQHKDLRSEMKKVLFYNFGAQRKYNVPLKMHKSVILAGVQPKPRVCLGFLKYLYSTVH